MLMAMSRFHELLGPASENHVIKVPTAAAAISHSIPSISDRTTPGGRLVRSSISHRFCGPKPLIRDHYGEPIHPSQARSLPNGPLMWS